MRDVGLFEFVTTEGFYASTPLACWARFEGGSLSCA